LAGIVPRAPTFRPTLTFQEQILNEFNLARTDPYTYSKKIESFIKYIQTDEKHRYFAYETEKEKFPKISLVRGESAFFDCIRLLQKMDRLDPLTYNEEIIIKVPDKAEEMNNFDKMASLIVLTKKKLREYYYGFRFHYDHCFGNAEVSAMLQIVDDTNSNLQRRGNILNRDVEYLGVSTGRIQYNRVIAYMTFAKSKL
jgi:hypothetical protein